jgi:hypothetical protein
MFIYEICSNVKFVLKFEMIIYEKLIIYEKMCHNWKMFIYESCSHNKNVH